MCVAPGISGRDGLRGGLADAPVDQRRRGRQSLCDGKPGAVRLCRPERCGAVVRLFGAKDRTFNPRYAEEPPALRTGRPQGTASKIRGSGKMTLSFSDEDSILIS